MKPVLTTLVFMITFGLSSISFASTDKQNLNCARDEFGDDEGYQVKVINYTSYSKAILYVVDPSGKHKIGKYKVIYHPADPEKSKNTAEYQGQNFTLKFSSKAKPRHDGLLVAKLTAISQEDGLNINETLLCRKENINELSPMMGSTP